MHTHIHTHLLKISSSGVNALAGKPNSCSSFRIAARLHPTTAPLSLLSLGPAGCTPSPISSGVHKGWEQQVLVQ